jgi:hypothetical protein
MNFLLGVAAPIIVPSRSLRCIFALARLRDPDPSGIPPCHRAFCHEVMNVLAVKGPISQPRGRGTHTASMPRKFSPIVAETALDCVCPDRQGVVCGHRDSP